MAKRTFEQWVDGIFNHPVTDPAWFWDPAADTCEEDDETNVDYLARLFTQSASILGRFDNAQVNQGVNLIANSSCSNHALSITHSAVSWPVRQRAIKAIYTLYAECFAARCAEVLSHRNETGNPLNYICYMWWDVLPAWIDPNDDSRINEADEYLAVMDKCLMLQHDACLEGALHGLGHWQSVYPDRVRTIIDRFLRDRNDLRPELTLYARRARDGAVQ